MHNWGNADELWWLFLLHLSTVFITKAVIMSKVDFIFPISLTEVVILFSAAIPASSMIAEAVVSCLLRFFWISLYLFYFVCFGAFLLLLWQLRQWSQYKSVQWSYTVRLGGNAVNVQLLMHFLWWFRPLPNLIIPFGFTLTLAYDHWLWCQQRIIVESELQLIAHEMIDIFSLIICLWSLSVVIACVIRLYTFDYEHTPYSQR